MSKRMLLLPVSMVFAIAAAMIFVLMPSTRAAADTDNLGILNIVHGIPNFEVDVCARGAITGGEFAKVLTNFNFKDIETLELPEGNYDAAVVLAGNDCSDAIPGLSADGLFLPTGTNVSVVAHLTEDGNAFKLSVGVNDTTEASDRRSTRVTAYHAAAAPAVDIRAGRYWPRTKLFAGVANGDSGSVDVRPGKYRAAIVPAGQQVRDAVARARVHLQEDTNTVIYAVGSLGQDTFTLLIQEIPLDDNDDDDEEEHEDGRRDDDREDEDERGDDDEDGEDDD